MFYLVPQAELQKFEISFNMAAINILLYKRQFMTFKYTLVVTDKAFHNTKINI